MNPTTQLKKEHEAITVVLDVLAAICNDIEAGTEVPVEHIGQVLQFLKVFADGCHHRKEEQHLFPALEAAGIPREHGPVGVMLAEHDLGRTFVRKMSEAFEEYKNNEPNAGERFVYNARGYANLLRLHIRKENEVLFPMADRVLSIDTQNRLVEDFDRLEEEEVGRGVHEAFHTMLKQLNDAYCKV